MEKLRIFATLEQGVEWGEKIAEGFEVGLKFGKE
jgi:hypothetical protein